MNTSKGIFGFVLFAVVLAGFVWLVDIRGIQTLMRQHRAESFPETEGQILGSKVVSRTGSKGRVYYHPSFVYTYEINDQRYRGWRYRYDGYPSDNLLVGQIVHAHPVGSTVKVYYNPTDPADACLSPMVVAQDVSMLFLFMPLTVMFLFLCAKAGAEINWPGLGKPVAGRVKIIRERMKTHVRLPRYPPSLLGGITAGALSLIAGLVIQLERGIAPIPASMLALGFIFVGGAAVYVGQYLRLATGRQDLIIDEGAQTFELPLTYKRRERRPLPFSEIKAVALEKVAHRGRYGVTYTYAPTLQMRDGSSEQLTDLSQNRAESFAAWLREKFGVPAQELWGVEMQ